MIDDALLTAGGRRLDGRLRFVVAAAAGALLTLSVPPFGFWPLGIVGLAVWCHLLDGRGWRQRYALSWIVAAVWMAVGISWFAEFSVAGYVISAAGEAAFLAIAGIVAGSAWGPRRLLFPAGVVVAEAIRSAVPFGGIPLAGLDLGQVSGPLAPIASVGGRLGLVAAAAVAGVAIESLAARCASGRRWAGAFLVVLFVLVAAAPALDDRSVVGEIDVALVQGGGPRGYRATDERAAETLRRHVEASEQIVDPVDLIVWPEDVVDVQNRVDRTAAGDYLASLAAVHNATVVAGIVEDAGPTRFRNVVQTWNGDGTLGPRYEKVRRVPYGEYFPGRSIVEKLADIPSHDAIPGTGPGFLETEAGPLGVSVSYEVFFPDRSRHAVNAGGEVLLVPTNAASFSASLVPTQQLAAARLRALETGRFVLQAGPTGYTAVIDPDGAVVVRTTLGEQAVLHETVPLIDGSTPFTRAGDAPLLALTGVTVVVGWQMGRRRPLGTLRGPAPTA